LAHDLRKFIDLYLILVSSEAHLFERADAEEDETELEEEDCARSESTSESNAIANWRSEQRRRWAMPARPADLILKASTAVSVTPSSRLTT